LYKYTLLYTKSFGFAITAYDYLVSQDTPL